LLDFFEAGAEVLIDDLTASDSVVSQLPDWDPSPALLRLGLRGESPGDAASALEFALEGLHLTRRLNKQGTRYGG
jgi:magnesium chelatase subunit I